MGAVLAVGLGASASGCASGTTPQGDVSTPAASAAAIAPSSGPASARPDDGGADNEGADDGGAGTEEPVVIDHSEWMRGEPGADPETDKPVIGPELVAAIGAVRAYGPAEHPEVYTGLRSGTAARPGVLTIYLTELDPAVQEEFIAASGLRRAQVRFEQSRLSQRDSLAVADRVKADIAAGTLDDVDLSDRRARTARDGLVELFLAGHDPSQIAALADRYGASIRIVTDAPPAAG